MKHHSRRFQRRQALLVPFAIAFLLLQGCAGIGSKPITLSSEPQGAEVFADGRSLGRTPLTITQADAFPPRWHGTSYMVKGRLELRKAGCETKRLEVNEGMLLHDIHVQLNCRPGSVTRVAPASEPASPVPASEPDIASRLRKLKELLDQGLIDRQEYRQQRKRILDSI